MIVYLAGNIGEREELFKHIIKARLYSYHYLKSENGAFKEFAFKMEYNSTLENRNTSVFLQAVEEENLPKKEKEPAAIGNEYPYLEIF